MKRKCNLNYDAVMAFSGPWLKYSERKGYFLFCRMLSEGLWMAFFSKYLNDLDFKSLIFLSLFLKKNFPHINFVLTQQFYQKPEFPASEMEIHICMP